MRKGKKDWTSGKMPVIEACEKMSDPLGLFLDPLDFIKIRNKKAKIKVKIKN